MKERPKILAVDDEPFNLDILTEFLTEAEFDVVPATDGVEALKQIEKHPDVDVIVLDRMMPNMDGMEALRKLKADERFRDIPVIMQTAAAGSEQVQEGIQAGVYYYLAKPYDQSLLVSIVKAALQNHMSRMEMRDEVQKQRRTLGLMERGQFRFRTLEETNNLSYFIANCFPEPEVAVYGLNELMVNAVEHGNLGITYNQKVELAMTGMWHAEVERRLVLPEYREKYATLLFEATPNALTVTIRDMGDGFDWQQYLELSPARATDPNGRGIAISRLKSFPTLEYRGNGNEVMCTVPSSA